MGHAWNKYCFVIDLQDTSLNTRIYASHIACIIKCLPSAIFKSDSHVATKSTFYHFKKTMSSVGGDGHKFQEPFNWISIGLDIPYSECQLVHMSYVRGGIDTEGIIFCYLQFIENNFFDSTPIRFTNSSHVVEDKYEA